MAKSILHYHRAAFPAVWLATLEPRRAVEQFGAELRADGSLVLAWDFLRGVYDPQTGAALKVAVGDPAAFAPWLATQAHDGGVVLFAANLHRFVQNPAVVQSLSNAVPDLEVRQNTIVALVPPGMPLPSELDRVFTLCEHALPTRGELAQSLAAVRRGNAKGEVDEARVLDAGTGLTAAEFANAVALSMVLCSGEIRADVVADEKAAQVRKNSSLELGHYDETFATLGGLENLKAFCARAVASPIARGVMLLGVPGTGKSAFAKALGSEARLPTLQLDMGRIFGSLVGQSEAQLRAALAVVDAMAPCVLFIDEIEKGLAGGASSGQTDGGVTSRVIGTFLSWLNDHESRVFVVATCNAMDKLPPEMLRAERWDAVFFVDLPTPDERAALLQIPTRAFGVAPAKHGSAPDLTDWTGAEIKTLCRLAAGVLDTTLADAARYVVPIAKSRAEDIQRLREWAKDRAVPASLAPPAPIPIEVAPAGITRRIQRGKLN